MMIIRYDHLSWLAVAFQMPVDQLPLSSLKILEINLKTSTYFTLLTHDSMMVLCWQNYFSISSVSWMQHTWLAQPMSWSHANERNNNKTNTQLSEYVILYIICIYIYIILLEKTFSFKSMQKVKKGNSHNTHIAISSHLPKICICPCIKKRVFHCSFCSYSIWQCSD